jgi:hypothetical protein
MDNLARAKALRQAMHTDERPIRTLFRAPHNGEIMLSSATHLARSWSASSKAAAGAKALGEQPEESAR